MSGQFGPRYDAGLIIRYDASNTLSYQNGGNTINNLTGNTLYGDATASIITPSFVSYQADGGGSMYINNAIIRTVGNINLGNDFTSIFWIKPDVSTGPMGLMNTGNTGAVAIGYRIFINSYPTSDGRLAIEVGNGSSGDSIYSALDTVIDYQWQQVAFTLSKTTNTLKIYYNGVNVASNTGLNISDWNTNGQIYIASLFGDYLYSGNMAIIKIYTKILSDNILLEEFYNNRNRFGI